MKKTNVYVSSMMLFLLLGLSSCMRNWDHLLGGDKGDPDPDPRTGTCNTYGTFRSVPCGGGLYGSLWIQLDNGAYLQPCGTDIINVLPVQPRDGQRVHFSYYAKRHSNSCPPSDPACDLPVPLATPIHLTCMQLQDDQNQGNCNRTGILRHNTSPNCDAWYIEESNGERFELAAYPNTDGWKDGVQVKFSGHIVMTLVATCTGYTAIEATCLEVQGGGR